MATIKQIDAIIGKSVLVTTVFNSKPTLMMFNKRVDQLVEYGNSSFAGKLDIDAILTIEPVVWREKPEQTKLEKEIKKQLTSEENSLLDNWLNDGKQGSRDEWIGRLFARSLKEITKGK